MKKNANIRGLKRNKREERGGCGSELKREVLRKGIKINREEVNKDD